MKNTFYFRLKTLFVFEICIFLSWLSGYVEEQFDKKAKVNFKIYDVTDWTASNHDKNIAWHLKKYRQTDNEIRSVNKI